ncbi:uncharacterized protein, partial [Epargyreus clarus]|uniref:uncharacterized protein n=1 Tax=Epargyreus clarus TaxID=520877 RepID=UPI003C2B20E8
LPGSAPRRRRRRRAVPPAAPRTPSPRSPTPSPAPSPSPPPPPPRSDSLRLSAEDMVLVANGGLRTPSGTLAHFLAYPPHRLCIARSDYLRPMSPARPQPRSSLSLRVDDDTDHPHPPHPPHSCSVHTLRRPPRPRSPPSPLEPSCDCLPTDPIPPPELFDF